MTQWTYKNNPLTEIPDGYIGFIYRITNLLDSRQYIGKKNFFAAHTRQKTITVKSTGLKKKKKIRSQIESDWKDYYGSSDELCKDVLTLGSENFQREIIHLCKTKGELSYMEAKFQFVEDVLLHPTKYYNGWISARIRRAHLSHMIKND